MQTLSSAPPPAGASAARLPALRASWLGRVPYAEGLRLQDNLVQERQQGVGEDTLLLLEHPAVVTLGRGADSSHLLLTPHAMRESGVEVFETGRGGDVTYHGPGQLVGYPILLLPAPFRDLHLLMRMIEEVLIGVASDFGIQAGRVEGLTGVWVGNEKLAAIGMRVSRWVTSHGFALNVSTDLSGFDLIVPCGIRGRGVTSLSRLLGRAVDMQDAVRSTITHFARVFECEFAGEARVRG
ncbi:MAG: lipoyl(octanoyl) transferase LipB [Acidobacteria bacterium]|nr:lipoyl(octanoyl) transferase LipB [Acidobacteriota bacterium]